jgi:hypothetical protein
MASEEFKLEAGKKYVDRRGRVFGPMIRNHAGMFGESHGDHGWDKRGYRINAADPRMTDLIAEYIEPVPLESPDDWVILDPVKYAKHVLRKDVDWIFYGGMWDCVQGYAGSKVEHYVKEHPEYKVRCRREDLPPLPEPTINIIVRKPVRLWISDRITYESGDWPVRCGTEPPSGLGSWTEIFPSPDGFYVKKKP